MYDFESVGTAGPEIPVDISYRIIELFSAGLYSSPNKAIEELVANAYDAMATRVDVVLSAQQQTRDTIWVIDNGQGMDVDGLTDLWRIARSDKRVNENANRPPIGKFGIGKLATFVLAKHLTHISRTPNGVNAVTMDFGMVRDRASDWATDRISLPARSLSDKELCLALQPLRDLPGGDTVCDRLEGEEQNWTVVALSDLHDPARELKTGRLSWILSTALPNHPQFKLFLNGDEVRSSKLEQKVIATWRIGKEDNAVKKVSAIAEADADKTGPFIRIHGLPEVVRGVVTLHEDQITGGKSSDLGRSHGFFVKVRGRLVNVEDELFGLEALSHGPFSRFRMEVDADGLDDFLTSGRESVRVAAPVNSLRDYLRAQFNEARTFYNQWLADAEREEHVPDRIARTPRSVSRLPLYKAILRVLEGSLGKLFLADVPSDLDEAGRRELQSELETALESDEGLIGELTTEYIRQDAPLIAYDPVERTARVNMLHPFVANYCDRAQSSEPLELVATVELLTEGYLLDEGLHHDAVVRILQRRDRFFRELVSRRRRGALEIAQALLEAQQNAKELEEALGDAFESLGFGVTRYGEKGKPDGVAFAARGAVGGTTDERGDYQVVYDAKSTGKDRVAAKTVGASTLRRHRKDFDADYSVVVAPDFAGDNPTSALTKECKTNEITPIRVRDLARLVLLAPRHRLGFNRLEELFQTARTPSEAGKWIAQWADLEAKKPPMGRIVAAIDKRQRESADTVTFDALAAVLEITEPDLELRREDVKNIIMGLAAQAPDYISVHDDTVILETSPEKIMEAIQDNSVFDAAAQKLLDLFD